MKRRRLYLYQLVKNQEDKGYAATMVAGVIELMESGEKNTVAIKVAVDTKEALKQMKEVTESANECAAALEKLESVMNSFTGKSGLIASGVIDVEGIKIASPVMFQTAERLRD